MCKAFFQPLTQKSLCKTFVWTQKSFTKKGARGFFLFETCESEPRSGVKKIIISHLPALHSPPMSGKTSGIQDSVTCTMTVCLILHYCAYKLPQTFLAPKRHSFSLSWHQLIVSLCNYSCDWFVGLFAAFVISQSRLKSPGQHQKRDPTLN